MFRHETILAIALQFSVPLYWVALPAQADVGSGEDDVVAIGFNEAGAQNGVHIFARTRSGLPYVVEASHVQNFCYSPFYGAGLVECLKGCDGGGVLAHAREPEFAAVRTTAEALRLNLAAVPYRFSGAGAKLLRVKRESGQILRFLPGNSDPAMCNAGPLGDRCLRERSRELLDDRFLARYPSVISVLLSTFSPSVIRDELSRIAALAGEVERLLSLRGLSEFRRGGHFYARNFRNAPVMFCFLETGGHESASGLLELLSENRAELERSRDFLMSLVSD